MEWSHLLGRWQTPDKKQFVQVRHLVQWWVPGWLPWEARFLL